MGIFSSGDANSPTIEWQPIKNVNSAISKFTYRAKIPGGWLVTTAHGNSAMGATFVPDPNHEWDGNSI